MKKAAIFTAVVLLGFSAGWFSHPVQQAREELPQGGMEVPISPVGPEPFQWYVFPIAEEDYLMKTSAFGVRVSPILRVERYHIGLDLAGVWRAQIVSVADGLVVDVYPPPGTRGPRGIVYQGHKVYGGMIRILHSDGIESLYAHLSSTRVREGQMVRAGDVIGRQGGTGLATRDHLHFEILVDGEPVNPLLYLPDVRGRSER